MLMTQDSIGHLKTLCMNVLLLSGGMESEWKSCTSLLSVKKTLSVNESSHKHALYVQISCRSVLKLPSLGRQMGYVFHGHKANPNLVNFSVTHRVM